MKNIILILALLLSGIRSNAQIGESWESFKSSDFYTFFGLNVLSESTDDDGYVTITCDPGSWQSEIDIKFTLVTDEMEIEIITNAELKVSRTWIEANKTFAGDLVKSFISDIICYGDLEYIENLVDAIYKNGILYDPVDSDFFDVYDNYLAYAEYEYENCSLLMENTTDGFYLVKIHSLGNQLAPVFSMTPPDKRFFIGEDDLALWMNLTEEDEYMRVFNSYSETINPFRVVEYVWQWADENAASFFHNYYLEENAENAIELFDHGIDLTEYQLHFYIMAEDNNPLIAALGLDMKAYIILFTIGNKSIKLFISGNSELVQLHAENVLSKALSKLEEE